MGDQEVYYSVQRRWFYKGDRKVPSMGRILDLRFPMSRWIDPWYLERGSMVHAATVMIDAGTLDWSALDPRIVGYCAAYRRFREIMPCRVLASEHKVCHPSGRFSGRLDRVYEIPGHGMPVVTDIKLGKADERYWLQDAGYAKAYDPVSWPGYPRALLLLGATGQPDLRFDPDPARHAAEFDELVDRYWKEVMGDGSDQVSA